MRYGFPALPFCDTLLQEEGLSMNQGSRTDDETQAIDEGTVEGPSIAAPDIAVVELHQTLRRDPIQVGIQGVGVRNDHRGLIKAAESSVGAAHPTVRCVNMHRQPVAPRRNPGSPRRWHGR